MIVCLCVCVYVRASQLFVWKEQVHSAFIVGPKNKLALIGHKKVLIESRQVN